jgi:hypothetical protein
MVAPHAERLGGLQLHLVMSWPEVLGIRGERWPGTADTVP